MARGWVKPRELDKDMFRWFTPHDGAKLCPIGLLQESDSWADCINIDSGDQSDDPESNWRPPPEQQPTELRCAYKRVVAWEERVAI